MFSFSRAPTIAPWRRKRGHNARYSVFNDRTPVGTVFESKGVFTAVTTDGDLVTASTSIQIAADALTTREASS
jgi:hypothetical protein